MNETFALNTGISLIDKGGPVMLVLLALSIIALTILLLKLYQFIRSRLRNTAFIDQTIMLLHDEGNKAALQSLAGNPHPIARVMDTTLTAGSDK
ncbi:uncharacterized protein METZ01_LOCUS302554, partial [marine metagenome]